VTLPGQANHACGLRKATEGAQLLLLLLLMLQHCAYKEDNLGPRKADRHGARRGGL